MPELAEIDLSDLPDQPGAEQIDLSDLPDQPVGRAIESFGRTIADIDLSDLPDQPIDPTDPNSYRPDGTIKGPGYLGGIKTATGRNMTELSIGVEMDGKETLIPSLVPSLTSDEIAHLAAGGKPTQEIVDKAKEHAQYRIKQGLNPFKLQEETEVTPAGMDIDLSDLPDQPGIAGLPGKEIKAPTAEDLPFRIASQYAKAAEKFFAGGVEGKPKQVISEEVARVGVDLLTKISGAEQTLERLERETGQPYTKQLPGMKKALAKNISGFTDLQTLASLPIFAVPGMAEAFGLSIVARLPEQYGRIKDTIQTHGIFSPEAGEVISDAGIQNIIGALAFKGGRLAREGKEIRGMKAEYKESMGPTVEDLMAREYETGLPPEIMSPTPPRDPAGYADWFRLQMLRKAGPGAAAAAMPPVGDIEQQFIQRFPAEPTGRPATPIEQSELLAATNAALERAQRGRAGVYAPTGEYIGPQPEMVGVAPAAPRVDPVAITAANEAAAKAVDVEVTNTVSSQGSVAENIDKVTELFPPPEGQSAPATAGAHVFVPNPQIVSRPDLMQFKEMDNAATGTAAEARITTPYDTYKAGALLLWEPLPENRARYGLTNEQRYIVANGHYRNEAAQNQRVEGQWSQIIREADGVSAADARAQAAWANIADGKGTIYDTARFIRAEAERGGAAAAVDRAREIGGRSRKAETIAVNASNDLYASFFGQKITPEVAAAIAEAAPGEVNAALQRLALKHALENDASAGDIYNFIQARQRRAKTAAPTASQMDIFGSDDSAIQQMEIEAKRASAIQREIDEQIKAIQGASRNPEKAARLGVNIEDPDAVAARVIELKDLRQRARRWAFDEDVGAVVDNTSLTPEQSVDAIRQRIAAAKATAGEAPITPAAVEKPKPPPQLIQLPELHELGPEAGGTRWKAIENSYLIAQAAEAALPGVPIKDIMFVSIYDKTKGKPGQEPYVGTAFVKRGDLQKVIADLDRFYPADRFMQKIETGVKAFRPRKGEPTYKEWLAGKRPEAEAPPTEAPPTEAPPKPAEVPTTNERLKAGRPTAEDYQADPFAAALSHASHSFVDADKRWASLQKDGASDAFIKAMLGKEFGIQGGFSATGMANIRSVDYKGGKNPQLKINYVGDKPAEVIKGKKLIDLTRRVLDIRDLELKEEGAPRRPRIPPKPEPELLGAETPFNLVNEFEFERVQREADAARKAEADAAAEAEIAKAEAEKAQGTLFPEEEAAPRPGATAEAPVVEEPTAPPAKVIGHERTQTPRDPADDPNWSALPVDLPEAVYFSNLMGIGIAVKKKLKALRGEAAGVFRHIDIPGREFGEIHLRADIADLLSPEDKARLQDEARAYAERMSDDEVVRAEITRNRYEWLLDKAYEEAKKKPPLLALKVIWHEIGHAVDWFRHAAEIKGVTPFEVRGRGNFFGHIAALHDHLKEVIALDPRFPSGKPMTPAEHAKMTEEAQKQMEREVGPMEELIETILVEEQELRMVGITAADVKNLLGMDARETMPQLYRWFAEQPAGVKKEILRKAMRGLLDERLRALGRMEVVGTRMVEREVRRTVGRMPTPEEVQARFKVLFRDEMKRRNLAELSTVKGELNESIAWWHGTDRMPAYFDTPSEMYAEAFSIFMNNPAALAKRAPTYARLIWNYMEHRPKVADIYNKIQNQIKAGVVKRTSEMRMLDNWDFADKENLELLNRQSRTSRDFLDNVSYHHWRNFGPVYRVGRGAVNEGELRAAIGGYNYRMTEHERVLGRLNREVSEKLVSENLDWKDLGLYMFYNRVVHERFKIFNPEGVTSQRALENLQAMKERVGEKAYAMLETARETFRKIYEEHVVEPMKREGMWSGDLQEAIDRNMYYATFDVKQTAHGKDGIERLLYARFGAGLSPHIYRQIGTVKEIRNPATATVTKMLSLTTAVVKNQLKRQVIRAIQDMDPKNVVEAEKRWTGKNWEYVPHESEHVGTIVYMSQGRPQAFYVRRVMADAINKGNHIENLLTYGMTRATSALKGLYTQLNYAFWPVNFARDTHGWVMQLPGATPVDWAREFPAAMKAAYASIRGQENRYADLALKRKMIISKADPRGVWNAAENEYELRVASYGFNPVAWEKEGRQVRKVVQWWNSYREYGQAIERANKIAAMNYLDRKFGDTMPEWKKAEIVRERGGSPDFLQRGASNPYIDMFAMFYNPWKEGLRSFTQSARENPIGFTAKSTAFVAIPTTMQVLAASGAFGDDIKEQYRSIPDEHLSNYLCVPMGWKDKTQKKVAYFTFPLWEPARIMHGLLWGSMTGRGKGFLSLYGGTLPGMNSILKVAATWAQYQVFGLNPYDTHTGKNVLDENTFKAAGWPARRELLKYSWNQLGGPIVYRFQNQNLDNPPTTSLEHFLRLPVVGSFMGRWIRVSNRGITDLDRALLAPSEQQRAITRLGVEEITRKILAKEGLTQNEKLLLRDPYAMQHLMSTLLEHAAARKSLKYRRIKDLPMEQRAILMGAEEE